MSTERSPWTAKAWVFLTSLAAVLGPQGRCAGQDTSPGTSSERRSGSDDVKWEPVPAAQVIPTLEMLAGQCTGNIQRLMTWEGSFNCTLKQRVRKSSLPAEFARQIRPADVAYVRQETVFDVDFAADLENYRLFNAKNTTRFRYLNDRTGEPVLENLKQYDENSVFTQEHFVRFAPKMPARGYVSVPGTKKRPRIHLGFQEAPVRARVEYNLGIVNPSGLFGFSPVRKFGEELALLAESYAGKHGGEFQQFLRDHLKLFTSAGPAGRRYRLDADAKQSPNAPALLDHRRMIFLPETGYNPISLVVEADAGEGLRRPRMKSDWTWRSTDGIFVPARVEQTVFTPDTGELSYELTVVLGRSTINPRLDDSRFSYKALGMANGDVINDDLTECRYEYRNGKLEKLGPIGGPPPARDTEVESVSGRFPRTRLMLAVSTIPCLLFVFAVLRARARRTSPLT